ncbi:hypothetical protein BCR43DRAFT_209279 [Syncephalastrum racemosum]|uniref:Uncharacterized protein n=1 Tax=Syncephalastrum racemosum TaxID=13706 RepID=A0A1X2HIG3_SYNRA|nr:hypothetical protein BCR43DRAFT_209279 [Syncephalastrum racemosum]
MAQTLQLKQQPGTEPRLRKKPLLSLENTEEDKKRRAWTEVRSKKVSPLPTPDTATTDDPFAGMKSSINYQQEIERLKALVPKMDAGKKKTSPRPRSAQYPAEKKKSPVQAQQQHQHQHQGKDASPPSRTRPASALCMSIDSNASVSPPTPTAAPIIGNTTSSSSRATSPTTSSSPYYEGSRMTSPISTPRSLSPAHSDYTAMTIPPVPEEEEDIKTTMGSSEIIPFEEKVHFLEFMQSWTSAAGTGGGWQAAWNMGDYSASESVCSGGSLWAMPMPWQERHSHSTNRNHHHHLHQQQQQYHR